MSYVSDVNLNPMAEIEDQWSNNVSLESEPLEPPLEGYPNVEEFDELVRR
jgi:hypothetical protein